jgi:hypothetical protein
MLTLSVFQISASDLNSFDMDPDPAFEAEYQKLQFTYP